jgi:predicted membrane GTPase involved in stress response
LLDVTKVHYFYGKGKAIPYSIDKLQDRGKFFVEPNAEIYEGQVIGENSRGDDMCVNVTKEKNNLTFVLLEMMKKLELFLQLFSL